MVIVSLIDDKILHNFIHVVSFLQYCKFSHFTTLKIDGDCVPHTMFFFVLVHELKFEMCSHCTPTTK